ncbi:hypothetical protein [Pseudomaricurvus hydrocarbonicus]|nr:hypothetical protein [Aestuariicella hydrocarbonica]
MNSLPQTVTEHQQIDPCYPTSYFWNQHVLNEAISKPTSTSTLSLRNRSPLGLSLFAPRPEKAEEIHRTQQGEPPTPPLLDALLREINLRQNQFKGRQTPWLHWQLPHGLLDNTDATQLMYFIGRQFQLNPNPDNHYKVSFTAEELDPIRLALFKGLGFNSLEVILQPQDSVTLELLQLCSVLSEDFHFQHFGLRLQWLPRQFPATLTAMITDGGRRPDTISFSPMSELIASDTRGLQALHQGLGKTGYSVLGNDHFYVPGGELDKARQNFQLMHTIEGYNSQNVSNIIGLGPGSTSVTGHIRTVNPTALGEYASYPFDRYLIDSTDVRIKRVIDHLLKYHQLDLSYFKRRYGLDLLSALNDANATSHIANTSVTESDNLKNNNFSDRNRSALSLYRISDQRLTLTQEGILQLSSLCSRLIRYFQ